MNARPATRRWRLVPAACLVIRHVALAADPSSPNQLANLSLQQLANLPVTSVSKATEPLRQAPASIYVITHDDIVRAGVTTVAEALRLAPNLLVSRTSSSGYVLAARGLGGNAVDQNFSNKLLVLIDGRSVYSPLYSGLYLDVQDVVMFDIDRIEVISGPGATLWGANAMNGVINIITRTAADSAGALVHVGAGTHQQTATARYGASLSEDTALRVYGKTLQDGAETQPGGVNPHDRWDRTQGGFRLDWVHGFQTATLQGDAYRGVEHAAGVAGGLISGANALARWTDVSGIHQWEVQSYVDQSERGQLNGGDGFILQTYDLAMQDTVTLGSRHRVVWGAGYRINNYDITSQPDFQWHPPARALTLGNGFAQDSYAINDRVQLTAGMKFEDDPYAGWQYLPDLRLAWQLPADGLLWLSASRAVRSPTPFDEDVLEYVPPIQLSGDRAFQPERVWDEELGFRARPIDTFSFSITAFYDEYSDLRTVLLAPPVAPPITFPVTFGNSERATTYGVELWADWRVTPWWRLSPGLQAVHERLSFQPGILELLSPYQAGDDPSVHATLTSSMDLGPRWTLNATWRYVGALPNPALPAYQDLDARLGWRVTSQLDVALLGSNLLHAHHLEAPLPNAEYLDREGMLRVTYRRP